jgi:hypothetical protein
MMTSSYAHEYECLRTIHLDIRLLPRELAYLSELRLLDLNGNELQGVIPHSMFIRMTRLEKLHLHMNDLFGQIPTEIGALKNLKELTMFGYVYILGVIKYEKEKFILIGFCHRGCC